MSKTTPTTQPTQKAAKKKADQYNDPTHNYLHYWDNRKYEHAAEEAALKKLLRGKRFQHAVDIGGGYGRLCVFLEKYAEKVTLAEPSQQQLDIAADFLKDHPEVDRKLVQADEMPFKDGTVDLFTMIRVMHHLPDPSVEFSEIYRSLAPGGYAIIEVANYAHARNRVKHLLKGQRMPVKPVDIRSEQNKRDEEIAFVNHNPRTVIRQLQHAGFSIDTSLSVSNLRITKLKQVLPHSVMLTIETAVQRPLASTFFGPSIFFLVRKPIGK